MTGPSTRAREPLLDSGDPTEDARIDLGAFVDANIGLLIVALAVAVLVAVVGVLALARRVRTLESRLTGLTRGSDGRSLEAVLDAHLDRVFEVARSLEDVATRTAVLEAAQRKAFSRVGLVRYNPFEETGGNQSFALALLDANGDGWVLSSLHARTGTRIYAKTVVAGKPDAAVSDEESAAIRQATRLTA